LEEINIWASRHNPVEINFRESGIVQLLDMINATYLSYTRLLIWIAEIAPQVGVID